jgi:hypothetical protein
LDDAKRDRRRRSLAIPIRHTEIDGSRVPDPDSGVMIRRRHSAKRHEERSMAVEWAIEGAKPPADGAPTARPSSDEATLMSPAPLPATNATEPSTQLESIVRSLRARLGESFDVAVITVEVKAELAKYSAARITQFVTILVEREVRARLNGRAPTGGKL